MDDFVFSTDKVVISIKPALHAIWDQKAENQAHRSSKHNKCLVTEIQDTKLFEKYPTHFCLFASMTQADPSQQQQQKSHFITTTPLTPCPYLTLPCFFFSLQFYLLMFNPPNNSFRPPKGSLFTVFLLISSCFWPRVLSPWKPVPVNCCACVLVSCPGLLPNGCALRRRVSFAACLSQGNILTELN